MRALVLDDGRLDYRTDVATPQPGADEVVVRVTTAGVCATDLALARGSAIMPATGTPEPGGLTWYQVMDLLHRTAAGRKICGFDVVELAPIPGMHGPDFTAAKLVYHLMGLAVG